MGEEFHLPGGFLYVINQTGSRQWNNATPTLDLILSRMSPTGDYIFATVLLFICTTSIFVNTLVLCTMWRRTRLTSPLELYVAVLAAMDLIQGVVIHPWSIVSSYSHRWLFGFQGCVWSGAGVFLLSTASIFTLVIMSIMRYIRMCHFKSDKALTRNVVVMTLVFIYCNSFIWSVGPMLGWGSYGLEPYGTSCTLDWKRLSKSYVICCFIFVYVFPLVIIIFCYSRMVVTVCESQRHMQVVHNRMDLYMTKMTVLMTVCFMIAWTPYAIMAFYYVLHDYYDVPPALSAGAALFAKSCIVYNPIVYFLAVRRFRRDAKYVLCRCLGKQVEEERDSTIIGNLTQNSVIVNRNTTKFQRQNGRQQGQDGNNETLAALLREDTKTGIELQESKYSSRIVAGNLKIYSDGTFQANKYTQPELRNNEQEEDSHDNSMQSVTV